MTKTTINSSSKNKGSKINLKPKGLRKVIAFVAIFALLACGFSLFSFSRANTASAAVGINRQINFQGKLVNLNGTNVADGTYSIVYSIYTVASAGTAIWTETQSVSVANGVFQVNLGSVTALPGSVDFNTDNIYLGIKVGADAEMTPRVQFTSVPQAFNSEKLGGLTSAGFIQNGTSQQATSNFNISGTGVANLLQATAFDSASAASLSLGATNATSLTIARAGVTATVAGGLSVTQATTLTGVLTANGGLINPGSTLNTSLALTNFATGGAIGTAATTVDVKTTFTISQTTAGQTLTLPSPTNTTAGREIVISNIGTTSFTIGTAVINPGVTASYFWNGTAWTSTGIDAGVTIVGNLNGGTANATGATISGNTIFLQSANGSLAGLVDAGAQIFAGAKTFSGGLTVAANQNLILASGSGSINQTFLGGSSSNAITRSVTNNNASATVATINAESITLVGGANANTNANIVNGINFSNVTSVTNNIFNGIVFGTGLNNLLSYNGTSVINGTGILQSASVAGTYGGITGVGAVASGSITNGFGPINIASNITTSTTIQGATLNATTGFTLNGANINTSGTLTNVAYLNQANIFAAANTFNAAISIQQTTAPAATAGFGKLYVSSADTKLHFVDSAGVDIALGAGGGASARSKNVVLAAEYAGAVLDAASDPACAAANSGSLSGAFDATARQNYYQWTSTGTSQCYDVVVHVPVPSDYASMNGAPTLSVYNSVGANTTAIAITAIDTAGATAANYAGYVGVSSTTTQATQSLPLLTGTYTAGGYLTFKVRMTSSTGSNVRIGNLTLNYTSAY